ncbi:TcmI family type II polyketide cyclase [Amycolatopsis thailandensis]|uniref:TcmI family type II polyketide cyclase n=1 Tax=Amycolatopsis thailandensis TaxID=589330 RepID=UPI00364C5D2F
MTTRTLIVARLEPGSAPDVARLFGASDRTELPRVLGVRSRRLYSYHDLYFHQVEFDGDAGEALRLAQGRPDFTALSAELARFVRPYDPVTWRGPADAVAGEFYNWYRP